jgi:hypothetical protein
MSAAITSPAPPRALPLPRPDRAEIAELSPRDLRMMSDPELIAVIRGADLPRINRMPPGKLEFADRVVLERLAYLARRCCRQRGY